jgi:hypothetical protein
LFIFRFYRQFFLFLFYFLVSVVCFTLRPGPPPKQVPAKSPTHNNTGINVTNAFPFGNNTTLPQMSSQLRLPEVSLSAPNYSLELYLQNRSLIKNIPLPYRMLSSPDYNDQTDEPSMSKNDTVTLDSGTVSMVNSYVGDVYSRNFSDNKQYSVPNRRLNESEKQQVAENKEKKARIKRDSESSSQVN